MGQYLATGGTLEPHGLSASTNSKIYIFKLFNIINGVIMLQIIIYWELHDCSSKFDFQSNFSPSNQDVVYVASLFDSIIYGACKIIASHPAWCN